MSLVGDLPLHDALGDRETPLFVKVRSHLVKPQHGAVLGRPLHAPAEAAVLGQERDADPAVKTQTHQIRADVYRPQADDRFQVVQRDPKPLFARDPHHDGLSLFEKGGVRGGHIQSVEENGHGSHLPQVLRKTSGPG